MQAAWGGGPWRVGNEAQPAPHTAPGQTREAITASS